MAHHVLRVAVLVFTIVPMYAQLPSLGPSGPAQTLSEPQIASGLREALSVGTQNAVKLVDKPGGYLENQEIKILLPSKLRPLESTLRAAGQGAKLDDFVASMNHAAEAAAPEAEGIFADAVRGMSIDDARKLLAGGNHSITDYFRSKTSANLTSAFRPHVEKTMEKNGVTQQYQALSGQLPAVPFMKSSTFDINGYVVGKALDGLFLMLGHQEEQIRSNPAARSTALLKQVFGQ